MSNYERGTDLKHCPDGCKSLRTYEADFEDPYTIICFANGDDTQTCPREQAERPVEAKCGNCSSTGLLFCTAYMKAVPETFLCQSWKERTNG